MREQSPFDRVIERLDRHLHRIEFVESVTVPPGQEAEHRRVQRLDAAIAEDRGRREQEGPE